MQMPACAAMNWTLDVLKEKAGENNVHVRRNTNVEDYKVIVLPLNICFYYIYIYIYIFKYIYIYIYIFIYIIYYIYIYIYIYIRDIYGT